MVAPSPQTAPDPQPDHLERVARSLCSAPRQPTLGLDSGIENTPLGRRLAELAEALQQAAGHRITIAGNTAGEALGPGLTLQVNGRPAVRFLAIPEGPEATPFAEALAFLAGLPDHGLPRVSGLEHLELEARLLVFIAPGCPHCPHAVRGALAIALRQPLVSVTVIDASAFAALAERFKVQSVPTTIVDDELGLIGVVPPQAIVHQLLERGSHHHLRQTLMSMITSGRIDHAATLLRTNPAASPALAAAWLDSTLETRLGLMLATETALDLDPNALDSAIEPLLPGLTSETLALRGDTADLLGLIAHPAALAALQPLLSDPDPDVAEAAAEAIEQINARHGQGGE